MEQQVKIKVEEKMKVIMPKKTIDQEMGVFPSMKRGKKSALKKRTDEKSESRPKE